MGVESPFAENIYPLRLGASLRANNEIPKKLGGEPSIVPAFIPSTLGAAARKIVKFEPGLGHFIKQHPKIIIILKKN